MDQTHAELTDTEANVDATSGLEDTAPAHDADAGPDTSSGLEDTSGSENTSGPDNTVPSVDELEGQLSSIQQAMDQLQAGDLDAAEATIELLEQQVGATSSQVDVSH